MHGVLPIVSGLTDASSKPKVLEVITRLDRGGSSEVVLFLANSLPRSQFQTVIVSGITADPPEDLEAYTQKTGVPIRFVKNLQREINLFSDSLALFRLYRIIRKERPVLVHTHTSKAGLLGRFAAHLAGVSRIVHTPHGHIFYGYYGPLKTALFVLLERLAAKVTSKMTTLTELEKEDHLVRHIGSPDQFIPIPCGIDLNPYLKLSGAPGDIRREWGLSPGDLAVGSVGRLVPIKGHCYFLEACPQIKKEIPKVKFILVGDGPLRQDLERLSSRLGTGALFLGNCTNIPEILQGLDLLVHPSLNEGLGRVLIEAGAAGKPVVATRVGGVPEAVEHGRTGLLVPPRDPSAIAEACVRLLKDGATREAMGRRAREKAFSLFDQQEMVKKVETLYRSLL